MNRTHRYKKWTYQPAANSYGVDKLEHQNILDNPALVFKRWQQSAVSLHEPNNQLCCTQKWKGKHGRILEL
jgi:hypothetical protein